ncbi:calcium-binding protein, partial [Cylindrospermopsis sp. CR12]|uniref:calcium-binding protein n=1 Tax=Cylindrospermopsis sp. CR12 TaxID=1747196 RepID=UPI000A924B57
GDNIITGSGDDIINGGDGNNTIVAGGGNNIINSGDGNDIITAGDEDDIINAGDGNDTIVGGGGNNIITAGDGDDTINGGDGNDTIDAGDGNDIINGANWNSSTPGSGEVDTLTGGQGNDRFILGDLNWVGYDNYDNGDTSDYALITDFTVNDIIQLQGTSGKYSLLVSGSDTQLYLNKPGLEPDELIAILRSTSTLNLSLTGSYFNYVNNDLPQRGIINLNSSNYTVNENGTANITLTRTNGSEGEVSVILTPSNGSANTEGAPPAIAGEDYTNTPITVTLADGQTSKKVTIPLIDDSIYEPTETVNLTLSNPTGGATLGTRQTATLTIIDNDAVPGVIQFSNGTYSINENETPVTAITLARINGSDGAVSVTLTLSNGSADTEGAPPAIAPGDYNNTSITVNFANGET